MKKILLIVDDEALIRQALSSQFGREVVSVLTASDGEQGLKLALEQHPDLILLDLVMPKMDGMTMLKKLRQDEWGKKVEVIILSNIGDDKKVSEAVDCNAYEYLVKVDWNIIDVVKKIKDKLGV